MVKMNILRQIVNFRFVWSVILMLVLLGLLTVLGCTPSAQDIQRQPGVPSPSQLPPAARVGRLAPDFTLTDLDGNSVTLSDFRGKTVFINFWATWCPPCRAEMPEIEAVYQEYKNQDVVVIGVDIRENESEVRQCVEEDDFSWIFVLDTTGAVSASYAITAIPTSFFLDEEGVIQSAQIGPMTGRVMEELLVEAMQ